MTNLSCLSREDALQLARACSETELFCSATRLREQYFGKKIELCAIINARSGQCDMDCAFCSQSRHHSTHVTQFPLLSNKTLTERILQLAATPVHHIGIVTSGGLLPHEECQRLTDLVQTLVTDYPFLRNRLCGSLGRLPSHALTGLHAVGLHRFHHNLESGKAFYKTICSTQTWEARTATIERAADAGFEICAGGLFGLGESWEDRIDLAFALKERQIKHVPINFLHAHDGTPLAGAAPLAADEALRIIAVYRHILPDATLRVCGGRPLVLGERQGDMFTAGANALMTGDYLTTDGCATKNDLTLIHNAGLVLI